MIKKALINFILIVGITLFGPLAFLYSNQDSISASLSNEIQNVTVFGKLQKGDPEITFNGKEISEFSLVGICAGFLNIYAPTEIIKQQMLNLIGQQVMISGRMRLFDMRKLIKANPFSECLKMLQGLFFTSLEVEKISPFVFYKVIAPEKTEWGRPFNLKLQFENPLEKNIENIQLNLFSKYEVYSRLETKISLSAREKKEISLTLEFKDNSGYARQEGAWIFLSIYGGIDNSSIFFSDDKIASYNSGGILMKEVSETVSR